MSSQLDSAQKDWVEAAVIDGLGPSKVVNSVLLGKSGVPAMPEQDQVIRLVQAALTGNKAAVDFMMHAKQNGRPGFSCQIKLVVPSGQSVDIARTLLNGQPRTMNTPKLPQVDTWMNGLVEQHLASRPSRVETPTWFWDLGQEDQFFETPQDGDDPRLPMIERAEAWRRSLPTGMKGTDLPTQTTRMAAGIRKGKPLDICFPNDATNTCEYKGSWLYTVLDEEGDFTKRPSLPLVGGKLNQSPPSRYLVLGKFNPWARRPHLDICGAAVESERARFRATVDGPITRA